MGPEVGLTLPHTLEKERGANMEGYILTPIPTFNAYSYTCIVY